MGGAIHSYMATESKDARNDKNFLGPWRHSHERGRSVTALKWTAIPHSNSAAMC
jgi:hypothetical protein